MDVYLTKLVLVVMRVCQLTLDTYHSNHTCMSNQLNTIDIVKSQNRSKLWVISISNHSVSWRLAMNWAYTRVGNFSFVDTCIVSDGSIYLCIMPNCLADNISLYCGGPYERFACSLVYEDLFTRPRLRQLRRAPFAARLGWERPATDRVSVVQRVFWWENGWEVTAVLLTTRFFEAHSIRHR